MFVRAKKKTEDRWQIQIVETVKVDGKSRQQIVQNIGTARSSEELEILKSMGERAVIDLM